MYAGSEAGTKHRGVILQEYKMRAASTALPAVVSEDAEPWSMARKALQ